MSSSSSGVGFRWLDILEKEFDKAFVMLDTTIGELDSDDPEVAYAVRQKMAGLSSCFAQLSHKAQTIFQNSAKVEAELINLRTELVDSRTKNELLEQQFYGRLPPVDRNPEINDQMTYDIAHLKCESLQLYRENIALRDTILALHSEVYGARLAAKYLDKELAGRIQQLQLLGREMKGELRDRLWRQLEAEILLQRHKTVVRACRSAEGSGGTHTRRLHPKTNAEQNDPQSNSRGTRGVGEPRYVRVPRKHHQGLGISITGGREHGVPILISELEADGPAAHTGQLYVGDAILSVNNIDLRQVCHKEAVSILQNQTGDCVLCVQFVAEDSDDDNSLSEDGYTFHYPVFPVDDGTGERTPTAPRTPDPRLDVPHTHLDRSGSEDISDYIQTPENNYGYNVQAHKYSQYPKFMHNSCYDNNLNFSPNRYDDLGYNMRQNKGSEYKNLYGEYNTGTNNKSIQHSILDMDDNTIKIETEIDNSILDCAESSLNEVHPDDLVNDNINQENIVNITIVDKVKNSVEPESQSNSESVSSPMQTSSDNIVNSSDPPPFTQNTNYGNLKSPQSSGEEHKSDVGEPKNDSLLIDINKSPPDKSPLKSNNLPKHKSSPFKDPKLKNNPLDVVLDLNDRKTLNSDPSLIDIENCYDKESRNNQNVGYLYPKLSTLKPFGLKQYQGLVNDIKNNFDGSSGSPDDSVETTPVHGKKPQVKLTKKKRVKAGDWKSKGAYQAINNANTSDMDSPVREVKPDKRYYKDNDMSSKFGVKTIQSIFDKSKRDKSLTNELKNNLIDDTSSELDSEVNVPKKSHNNSYKHVDESSNTLMKFTPEHALPNLKPDSSVVVTLKKQNSNEKIPDNIKNGDDKIKSENDNKKTVASSSQTTKANHNLESSEHIPKHSKHEKSARKLSLKDRGFRIGSAKRVPPPPDVIHIPLKDISAENFEKHQSKFDPDISSLASQKNFVEAAAVVASSNERQEKIETEINDIYPMLESIMKSSQGLDANSDVDIDTTLKLALGKLEKSMMNSDYEMYISKASKYANNYKLPSSNKGDSDHSVERPSKLNRPKRTSLSNYTISKDIVVEGTGDPDFGTPV